MASSPMTAKAPTETSRPRWAEGETTADGRYSLEGVGCLGCCAMAPVVVVDGELHGRMNRVTFMKIVDALEPGDHRDLARRRDARRIVTHQLDLIAQVDLQRVLDRWHLKCPGASLHSQLSQRRQPHFLTTFSISQTSHQCILT